MVQTNNNDLPLMLQVAALRGELRAAQMEIDRLRGEPPVAQERDHLAKQCATLLRENDQWRTALKDLIFAVDNDKQVYPCGGLLLSTLSKVRAIQDNDF